MKIKLGIIALAFMNAYLLQCAYHMPSNLKHTLQAKIDNMLVDPEARETTGPATSWADTSRGETTHLVPIGIPLQFADPSRYHDLSIAIENAAKNVDALRKEYAAKYKGETGVFIPTFENWVFYKLLEEHPIHSTTINPTTLNQ